MSSVALAAASSNLWCDPAGGAATLTVATGAIAIVDLATGTQLASVEATTASRGSGGRPRPSPRARDRRDVDALPPRRWSVGAAVQAHGSRTADWPHARPRLRFSPDGARLAYTRSTLVVIGRASEARPTTARAAPGVRSPCRLPCHPARVRGARRLEPQLPCSAWQQLCCPIMNDDPSHEVPERAIVILAAPQLTSIAA